MPFSSSCKRSLIRLPSFNARTLTVARPTGESPSMNGPFHRKWSSQRSRRGWKSAVIWLVIGSIPARFGPFAITKVAGQGQVVKVVGREMLPGDDVLQMVSKFTVFLAELAILTAISSLPAYALANGLRLHAVKRRCAFNLRMVIKSAPSINASYSASSSGVSSPSLARFAK